MFVKKNTLCAILSVIVLTYIGCKKTERIVIDKEVIEIKTPISKFTTLVTDRRFAKQTENSICVVDSNFYFRNLSDSGSTITYAWDFGDGNSSNLRHPKHTYKSSGTYTVRLITINSDIAKGTTKKQVSVIAGQHEYDFNGLNTNAIDIAPTNDGNYLLLGSRYDSKTGSAKNEWFLMLLDNDLRQKSVKILPTTLQLYSLQNTGNGNMICTGNTSGNEGTNQLIKITQQGDIVWSKDMGAGVQLFNVQQTLNSGFIITGSKNYVDNYGVTRPRTLVIKTDADGSIEWQNHFKSNVILEKAKNVAIDDNGYTITGIKPKNIAPNYYCDACDSISTIKLNRFGGIINTNTFYPMINNAAYSGIFIHKTTQGNYLVTPANTNSILVLNTSGVFTDRKLMSNTGEKSVLTTTDDLAVLQSAFDNGLQTYFRGYTNTGIRKWDGVIDKNFYSADGYGCCASSWAVNIKALKNGEVIILINKIAFEDNHYIATIIKANKNGQIL